MGSWATSLPEKALSGWMTAGPGTFTASMSCQESPPTGSDGAEAFWHDRNSVHHWWYGTASSAQSNWVLTAVSSVAATSTRLARTHMRSRRTPCKTLGIVRAVSTAERTNGRICQSRCVRYDAAGQRSRIDDHQVARLSPITEWFMNSKEVDNRKPWSQIGPRRNHSATGEPDARQSTDPYIGPT